MYAACAWPVVCWSWLMVNGDFCTGITIGWEDMITPGWLERNSLRLCNGHALISWRCALEHLDWRLSQQFCSWPDKISCFITSIMPGATLVALLAWKKKKKKSSVCFDSLPIRLLHCYNACPRALQDVALHSQSLHSMEGCAWTFFWTRVIHVLRRIGHKTKG